MFFFSLLLQEYDMISVCLLFTASEESVLTTPGPQGGLQGDFGLFHVSPSRVGNRVHNNHGGAVEEVSPQM